jgi:hypothetical protein
MKRQQMQVESLLDEDELMIEVDWTIPAVKTTMTTGRTRREKLLNLQLQPEQMTLMMSVWVTHWEVAANTSWDSDNAHQSQSQNEKSYHETAHIYK